LRQLGIPAAGIVDIDVVKEGGSVWTNLLGSAYVPEISHSSLGMMRASVKGALELTGQDMKRHGGIAILGASDREAASKFFAQLSEYGVFVVPVGEVESWLRNLGATGHGPEWLVEVFQRMGEDPDSTSYGKPTGDDVWQFISQVRGWLLNPDRNGIPD
jgi:hypothetical protein